MSASGVMTMTKKLTKEAQIVALTETNGQLQADVLSLSDAVGELEAEIVTERATAARLVQEAQAKALEALAKTAGDAGADLVVKVEWLEGVVAASKEKTVKLEEELRWEKGGRADDEEASDKLLNEKDNEIDKLNEEIGRLEGEAEKAFTREDMDGAEAEAEDLRNALKDYFADLGYASDAHWATITCPHLRRLAQAI